MAKYIKTEQGYIDASIFAPAQFKPAGKSYLTFSSPKSFTLKVNNATKNWDGTLEYFSADKVWAVWDGTTILSAYNNDGEYVLYLRGTGNTKITGLTANGSSDTYRWVLTGSDIACVGNIENLLDYATVESGQHPTMADYCYPFMFYDCTALTQAPSLPATTLADYCYCGMFVRCTSLTQAPVLPAITLSKGCYQDMFFGCTSLTQAPALPATTLADYCYPGMFRGCTSLTQVPALPATTLADTCYYYMFENCTALTQAPELPATTLANRCYERMFCGCTSLTQAPALPATTLANNCYERMFRGCTSLTQAPALPATTLAEYCYYRMFSDCTSLTKAPTLPATTLANGCYYRMFENCTSLKLSSTKTGEYTQEYRIPSSGTGTTASNALTYMFASTGGTFTGTPDIGITYYLSTNNMIVRDTEVATLNGYVGSMIDTASVQFVTSVNGQTGDVTLTANDVDAIDKYNGMTPVECVYTHFGSQQTKIIYVEEGTLIPPSSSASDDIKNAWKKLLGIPLSGLAATGPNSSFKDLIRGIGLLADNGVFGDLLSQSGNEFICYTDIFKSDVCLHIYNSKTDDKTITVYFNFYKQDKYQQVIYCISNDTFDDYCSFDEPVKKYSNNINTTALTMPQTEMAAAPTKDMHIATKKYVDNSVSNPLNITGATVGQIAKITAVDDSGKPTAWEAVDMPGDGDVWELIYYGEITEDIGGVIVNKDSNGNDFSLKEYKLIIKTVAATENPNSGFSWYWHNDDSGTKGPFYTISGAHGGETLVFTGKLCGSCWYCQYISDNGSSAAQIMRNELCQDGGSGPSAVPVYKLTLSANAGNTCGTGSKVALFGVRA